MKKRKVDPPPPLKVADSGKDFKDLMRQVPAVHFNRMVYMSGLTPPEQRELCVMFEDFTS